MRYPHEAQVASGIADDGDGLVGMLLPLTG